MDDKNLMEKIYDASLKFLVPMNLEQTYEVVVREALKLVKAELGSIFLYEKGEFKRVYANNPAFYKIKVRKKGSTYRVFRSGKAEIIDYKKLKRNPHMPTYIQYGIEFRNDIMIPLSYQDKSIGVLTVMSVKDHQFTQKDVDTLTLLVPLATLAIRKAQLYTEVKKALEVRDLFISMAAHELRTPLTVINGYLQLIKTKIKDTNTVEARWMEELYGESVRLTLLVNELLEINRIKSGEFNYNLKEGSVNNIVQRAVNNIKFVYPDREIIYKEKISDKNDIVIADYDKILQAVTNLVDNAVKFSPSTKPIHIFVESKRADVKIRIKDEGIGIPKEDLPKVFEGYHRGQNNKAKEGMGIGLFIVKDIVKKHHGKISIKSRPNLGTVIDIELPRVKL